MEWVILKKKKKILLVYSLPTVTLSRYSSSDELRIADELKVGHTLLASLVIRLYHERALGNYKLTAMLENSRETSGPDPFAEKEQRLIIIRLSDPHRFITWYCSSIELLVHFLHHPYQSAGIIHSFPSIEGGRLDVLGAYMMEVKKRNITQSGSRPSIFETDGPLPHTPRPSSLCLESRGCKM